jgi:hypothetical protein
MFYIKRGLIMTRLQEKKRDLTLVENDTIFILSTEDFDTTLKVRFNGEYKTLLINYLKQEIKKLEELKDHE